MVSLWKLVLLKNICTMLRNCGELRIREDEFDSRGVTKMRDGRLLLHLENDLLLENLLFGGIILWY